MKLHATARVVAVVLVAAAIPGCSKAPPKAVAPEGVASVAVAPAPPVAVASAPVPVVPADVAAVPALPADACADMACFIAAASSCRAATVVDVGKLAVMGVESTVTTQWTIVGREADRCVMTSSVKAAAFVLSDETKDMLRNGGKNEAAIAAETTAMADDARSPTHDQRCVMTTAAMTQALNEMSRGVLSSQSWAGCTQPSASCSGAAPAPAAGCSVGACDAGAWPITCGAEKCRLEGEAAAGMRVSCSDGSVTISFGG